MKIEKIIYGNEDGTYTVDLQNKSRYSTCKADYAENIEICQIYYDGKDNDHLAIATCKSDRINLANKIKKEYEQFLKHYDVTENRLISIIQANIDKESTLLKQKLITTYSKQLPISNEVILSKFQENGFDVIKNEDKSIIIARLSENEFDNLYISSVLNGKDGLPNALFFITGKTYSSPTIDNLELMYTGYFDNSYEMIMSPNGQYMYDLTHEKSVGTSDCDKTIIDAANDVKISLYTLLQDVGITKKDLLTFLQTY